MRQHQCQLNGLTVNAVTTESAGPPLVMLHGVTRRWQTFVPLFPTFQLRWDVWALDARGHGESSRVPGHYRVTEYADDLTLFVQQQFQAGTFRQPVVLYGHSLGAMVVAAAAARLGEMVRATVMEDPPFHTMGQRISENVLHSLFRGMHQYAGDPRPVSEIAAQLADVSLLDPRTLKVTRLGEIRDNAALRFTAASLKQVDPDVFAPIVAGEWLVGYDVQSVFQNLRCPALLIQADIDRGGMLTDEDAAAVCHWAADMSLIRLPGAGHMIHYTHTSILLNLVHSFLESVR
jgi:pimeloyl-ACP methyl ester carboxylesterase